MNSKAGVNLEAPNVLRRMRSAPSDEQTWGGRRRARVPRRTPWHARHPRSTYRLGCETGRDDNPTRARRRAPAAGEMPATACRRAARVAGGRRVAGGGCWSASHPPITWSSASGSMRASTRADGGLAVWLVDPAQRVAARPERGQDRPGRVRRPFADRGQGPGAGQHRSDPHGQHRAQRMPAAASPSRIGELGEVGEQAAALVTDQRGGRARMGGRRDGG
jgi:hypothetical protein